MGLHIGSVALLLLMALFHSSMKKTEVVSGECNIPAGSSPLATRDQNPVRFNFTHIQGKPDGIFRPLAIEEHFFTVRHCFMTVYVKSAVIPSNPLPPYITVAGQPVGCVISSGTDAMQVTGRVLRYIDQQVPRPSAVPHSWYQGNRLVQEIKFYTFPKTSPITIRCGVRHKGDILGSVEVFAEMTINKIGCPTSSWGTGCEKDCPCQNGGYCHTFEDTCFCTDDYAGAKCENNLLSTAESNNTAITPAPSHNTPPLHNPPPSRNPPPPRSPPPPHSTDKKQPDAETKSKKISDDKHGNYTSAVAQHSTTPQPSTSAQPSTARTRNGLTQRQNQRRYQTTNTAITPAPPHNTSPLRNPPPPRSTDKKQPDAETKSKAISDDKRGSSVRLSHANGLLVLGTVLQILKLSVGAT